MTPGLRVSQLMNIAFDMAAWVCSGLLAEYDILLTLNMLTGDFG